MTFSAFCYVRGERTIFEKAIADSAEYDEAIARAAAKGDSSAAIYEDAEYHGCSNLSQRGEQRCSVSRRWRRAE
jgi:hypothetical protein